MKKILFVFFCLVIIMNFNTVSLASDINTDNGFEAELQYTYTSATTTSLNISSNVATCRSTLIGQSNVTKIEITMTLQKESWLWWSTVETWTSTTYSDIAYLSETYSVDSDNYRVKTVFKVYSGTDYETITVYSSEVEC